jgi:hypothetical protein
MAAYRTETETYFCLDEKKGADFAFQRRMSDEPKLPSTRQILASDAPATRDRAEPAAADAGCTENDDFRRVMSALRAVLQVRGS